METKLESDTFERIIIIINNINAKLDMLITKQNEKECTNTSMAGNRT